MLLKKYTISPPAKELFTNSDVELPCVREERFEIYICGELFEVVYMIPSDFQEFITGYLINNKFVDTKEQIASSRMCEANRFHVYLDEDTTREINQIGGTFNYYHSFPKMCWGDIIAIRSRFMIDKLLLLDLLDAIDKKQPGLTGDSTFYYAAYIEKSGVLKGIYLDINQDTLIDKFCGGNNEEIRNNIFVSNCIPNTKCIYKLYNFRIPFAVFTDKPTGGANVFAKKAGITLVTSSDKTGKIIFSDTCKRITSI